MFFFFFHLVRLSERNGDLGKGVLEIYKVDSKRWVPACVNSWNSALSPQMVCSLLGYNSVNSSRIMQANSSMVLTQGLNSVRNPNNVWRLFQRKRTNLIKEFGTCEAAENAGKLDLTCTHYGWWLESYYLKIKRLFTNSGKYLQIVAE